MICLLRTYAAVAFRTSCVPPSKTCGSRFLTYASFVAYGMGTTCWAVSFMAFGYLLVIYLDVPFLVCAEIPCLTWGLSLMECEGPLIFPRGSCIFLTFMDGFFLICGDAFLVC